MRPTLVEGFPSGQREQTVNLPAPPSMVRIRPPPPLFNLLVDSLYYRQDVLNTEPSIPLSM